MAQDAPPAPPPSTDAAQAERVAVPEPTAQALAYHRSGNILWVFNTVWGLVVPAVFLWTGFSARMRDWARAIGRKWIFPVAVYWVIFTVASTLIDLPRVYYESFVRQHAYGLSNQTIGKWASDQFANLAVTLVIGGLVLWVPYLLLRKSPTRWWLYTSALAVPFIITIVLVQPLWIDPLFNRFGPMQDKTLEAEILATGGPVGHRRRPRLRGGQERGHQGAQRLRHRLRRHQAHRALGHHPEGTRPPAAPVRDGARDGPLRARARVEADHPAVGDHPRIAVRRAPPLGRPDREATATASGSSSSATWRRCR